MPGQYIPRGTHSAHSNRLIHFWMIQITTRSLSFHLNTFFLLFFFKSEQFKNAMDGLDVSDQYHLVPICHCNIFPFHLPQHVTLPSKWKTVEQPFTIQPGRAHKNSKPLEWSFHSRVYEPYGLFLHCQLVLTFEYIFLFNNLFLISSTIVSEARQCLQQICQEKSYSKNKAQQTSLVHRLGEGCFNTCPLPLTWVLWHFAMTA